MNMNTIPKGCFLRILKMLPITELLQLRLVAKRWKRMSDQRLSQIESITVNWENGPFIPFSLIKNVTSLTLVLTSCNSERITRQIVRYLELPNLTKLELDGLPDRDFLHTLVWLRVAMLSDLKELSFIHMDNVDIPKRLLPLTRVERFVIRSCNKKQGLNLILRQLKACRALDIINCIVSPPELRTAFSQSLTYTLESLYLGPFKSKVNILDLLTQLSRLLFLRELNWKFFPERNDLKSLNECPTKALPVLRGLRKLQFVIHFEDIAQYDECDWDTVVAKELSNFGFYDTIFTAFPTVFGHVEDLEFYLTSFVRGMTNHLLTKRVQCEFPNACKLQVYTECSSPERDNDTSFY